jgi:hypothetical protein
MTPGRAELDCERVSERLCAGEALLAHEAAHALGCARCEEERTFVQSLEAAGRSLALLRTPAPGEARLPFDKAAPRPRTRRRLVSGLAIAAALAGAALALATPWLLRAPEVEAPAPRGPSTLESTSALIDEVRQIRGSLRLDGSFRVRALWILPSAQGAEEWTLEGTPLEELLPESYAWLSDVLSASSL